ncbi:DUF4239 domain-containing protein [Mesorhizobium sp. BAC0120]|uniref:bestrophin-like domain n=1 Tax=Mesorhizobium sp. BAC0120 TaxID=3090670 RepID=UPI00298CBCEB|nr:DUF4239 domain-containing protein [Mesorhizobium sp. BAC0120]MDW6025036.1 DUF4239 domain-containing protein [Mesorhizobium sp. BAC0120]
MTSVVLSVVIFVCLFGAALLGMLLRTHLPDEHLTAESRDVIKLATAVVGTLSALVLGLLIASAKSDYDGAELDLRASAGHLVLLDRVMAQYGPETQEARTRLKQLVIARLDQRWGDFDIGARADNSRVDPGIEPVQEILRSLTPKTDAQHWLQTRALDVSGKLAEAHWLLVETGEEGLPWPFLIVMAFWLAVLFATFGLFAPGNSTVVLVLLVCSLSVAGAVFLIVDLANPYLGLIYISDAPLRDALEELGRS